ncbi:soluble guanylate cyclase 88E-like isoform X3 [Pomacea canaliculata]|uniref:soluble guanylate cyclase 88E-like isoform X3 n=1 Tax=Pomacea canaliculata TaxID=400727 RepID=UPI000D735084|nr:soluble guanylate cyclase 88E-like isoform X3 [Pomacea canaliculata]
MAQRRRECEHATMYGLLLESIQHHVQELHGEQVWQQVLQEAGLRNMVFSTHRQYSDQVMVQLASACSKVLSRFLPTVDCSMHFFGTCFVTFCAQYGYDKILRVAGRNYCDFLHGIDNLHETIRFSYPRMQSPSFMVEEEDADGCVLVYHSQRKGFSHYVIGQLQQCGLTLYGVKVDIKVLKETPVGHGCHVRYRLDFNNSSFTPPTPIQSLARINNALCPVSGSILFKLFPFCIVFGEEMVILRAGPSAVNLFSGQQLVGSRVTDIFSLRRPPVDFTWNNILCQQNVVFELESPPLSNIADDNSQSHGLEQTLNGTTKLKQCVDEVPSDVSTASRKWTSKRLLRGQMKLIKEWGHMTFLCAPLVGNLEELQDLGMFINDLNLYDSSREMVIAGWQHASQLEYLMEQQVEKSNKIRKNLKALDKARTESNKLLYSMLPETIAVRLKHGEDPINTCQTFDAVTILFSYLVGFKDICSNGSAMDIVRVMNNSFMVFDPIVDKYGLFKVETLGDAVYMVAGGVPDVREDHAQKVAHLALEFVSEAHKVKCPLEGTSLSVRIGMHTGSVVAGIVGKRTPQYCLFGDTVNTAARMQSHSQPGRIHLSQPCHECLKGTDLVSVYRGRINVKGKGELKTYWLAGRCGQESTRHNCLMFHTEHRRHSRHHSSSSVDGAFDLHSLHSSTSASSFQATTIPADDDDERTTAEEMCTASSHGITYLEEFPEDI